MRVGIYNHQHQRGGCPGCSQTYVKGMIADGEQCKNAILRYYGPDNEFVNYTDLGDYPAENVDRPGYRRMIADIQANKLDVIVTIYAGKISNDINLILEFYQECKNHNVDFLSVKEGPDVMKMLDVMLEKRGQTVVHV